MKTIQCEVKVLPNGYIVIPPDIFKLMKTKPNVSTTRRIIIFDEEPPSNRLSRFCGKWNDDRDADDIIADITESRNKNFRSDKIEF